MNKKWKKIIVGTTMITGVSLLLTACGSEKKAETKKDIPTLLMYEIGQRPKNFDTLLDKVNQTMEKEAGVKLNIQFVDYGDYKQKMSVVVSSGENYDIAFADNYVINAQKGAYADLEPLLKVVKENEPAVVPIATGPNYKVYENVDYIIDNNMPFVVRTSGDTSKIENIYNLPETKRDLKVMHDFYQKGYVAKDAATSTNTYPLGAKTWFVRAETQGPFDYGDTILTNAAGETILSVPITDPVKKSSNVRMANFVVSANSKYQKEAVKALDVLNTNSDVLNTLVYGIEGKSWEKDGEHSVKFLSGYQPETHLSGWNVGNNKAFYTPEGITEKQVKERDEGIEKATYSPILGFNFVPDKVKTEITNISNVMSKYQRGLNTGTLDPDKAIPQMNQELEKAGMDKVLTEMQTQYDHFLEEK